MIEVAIMPDVEMQKEKRSAEYKEVDDTNTLEPTLPLKLGCEFVGTFGLAYTIVQNVLNNSGVPTPVCAAVYLILMVYGIGSVSGCHINPAVSTAVFFWGAISKTMPNWMIEYPLYVLSQVAGALLGGYIAAAMSMASNVSEAQPEYNEIDIFPYRPGTERWGMAMISEAFAIFFFTFAILRVCCDHDKPPQATDGIVIGIALLTAIVGTAKMSGGGVNPAIATGLRIVNYALVDEYGHEYGDPKEHGEESFFCVYWLGPIIGALLAAGFHYVIEFQTSITFGRYTFLHSGEGRAKQH